MSLGYLKVPSRNPGGRQVPASSFSVREGDLEVVWHSDGGGAHDPSVTPNVYVVAEAFPTYLPEQEGFELLTTDKIVHLLHPNGNGSARPSLLALPPVLRCEPRLVAGLGLCHELGIPARPLAEVVATRFRLHLVEEEEELAFPVTGGRVRDGLWRVFDVLASFVGLAISAVLLPFIALAMRLDDAGPVFYRQERVGYRGRRFEVIKFRTMRANAEAEGPAWATLADTRVTRVGRYLRKLRIDELPQFWNVLKGEMAVVGPRPERPVFVEQLRKTVPHYEIRHQARPGLTGWGTVSVGYGNTIEAKYLAHCYDVYHLRNRTLRFDLEIILRSLRILLFAPKSLDRCMR